MGKNEIYEEPRSADVVNSTELLRKELRELKRINESFQKLMEQSLKELILENGPVHLPHEITVTTGEWKSYEQITDISVDSESGQVILGERIEFRIQPLRKKFIIYLDVLDYFRIPADDIAEVFHGGTILVSE